MASEIGVYGWLCKRAGLFNDFTVPRRGGRRSRTSSLDIYCSTPISKTTAAHSLGAGYTK